MSEEPHIWWTDQEDAERIYRDRRRYQLPAYLREQFTDRYGRNGRGRLWVDAMFGDVAVEPWPSTAVANWLASKCAGIVIRPEDGAHAARLGGVVTDLRLDQTTW